MKKGKKFATLALSAMMAAAIAAPAVPGTPLTLGEKIGLGPVTAEAAQETVQLPDGWYYIKNVNAQKYLQVAGDQASNVTNVEIRQGSGSAGQKWYLQNRGDGYVTLKSGVGNFNIDIANGSSENNANVQIYDAYNGNAQQFIIQTTDRANAYAIASRASNGARVLDAEGRGTTDGTNVLQWQYTGGTNQQWIFEPVSGQNPVQPTTKAVAAAGDKVFDTLQDAVDNAGGDHKIRLLKPVDISATGLHIPKSKKITLDLAEVNADSAEGGEKTIALLTGTGDKGITVEGGLIITDSDDEESIIATKEDGTDALITVSGSGSFHLLRGVIDSTGSEADNGGSHAVIANDNARVTIKEATMAQAKIIAKNRSTVVLNDKATLDTRGGSLINLNSVVVEDHSATTLRFSASPYLRSGELGKSKGSYVVTTDKGHVAVAGGIFKTDARVSCLYASGTGSVNVAGGYYRQDVPDEQIADGFAKTVEYIVDDNAGEREIYYVAIRKASEVSPTPTEMPVSETYGTIYATNLTLKGKVGLNAYLALPERILNDADAVIEITRNGKKDTFRVSDLEVFEANRQKLVSVTTYVTAKEMSDDIDIKVLSGKGVALPLKDTDGNRSKNGAYTTSVKETLAKAKNNSGIAKNLKTLYSALETYGQYAQLYFKHNSEGVEPADALTDVKDSTIEAFKAKKSGSLSGVSFVGGNLILDSDTTLMIYFTSGKDLSNYTFAIDGKEMEAEKDGNYYILTLNGIEAKNLNKAYAFSVFDGKNTLTVNYSALTYAATTLSGSNPDLVNVMKAMYKYNVAADAYFNS